MRHRHGAKAAVPGILRLHLPPLADLVPVKTTPQPEGQILPDSLSELFDELVLANRILANEGVLDAFGHVSVRHPKDPGRYLLARSRAPALVVSEDILEYTLDSEPVKPPVARPVTERTIHGCIYAARSDVMAVCHHHAPAVLPFCVAGKPIVPVFHLGATIGEETPLWDQQDEFGDTNLLVANNDEGRITRPRARPPSGRFDAPSWRHRRRRQLARTRRALDLPVPECRVSDARAFARRAADAASGRSEARGPKQHRTGGAHQDMGFLSHAAGRGRPVAAAGRGEDGSARADETAGTAARVAAKQKEEAALRC